MPQSTSSSSSFAVQVFNVLGMSAAAAPGVVYGVLYSSSGFSEVAFTSRARLPQPRGHAPPCVTLASLAHLINLGEGNDSA